MIYTERNQLPIIELQEERTSFSYEEIFQVLMERPALAVYVELKGILYGMITLGRIKRAHTNHLERVGVNTRFTSVAPDETMRARELLSLRRRSVEQEKNLWVIPVTDPDGKLLGNYTTWDDFLSIEYSFSLFKILRSIEFKSYGSQCTLVKPNPHCPEEYALFLNLKNALEQKGIVVETIDFHEILEHFYSSDYILCCDETTYQAARIVCQCLLHSDYAGWEEHLIYYLQFIKNLMMYSPRQILEAIQAQGVHVLLIGVEETPSGYWEKLKIEIADRFYQNGKKFSSKLLPEMREGFLLDLCEQFADQELPFSISFHIKDSMIQLRDVSGPLFNIKNGQRLTIGQPESYDRCIYLFGPCTVVGIYTDDQHTICSLLQEKINDSGLKSKVVNYGALSHYTTNRLVAATLKQGDIVVSFDSSLDRTDLQTVNLVAALEQDQAPSTWFTDDIMHCNHKANQVFANAIYETLLPVLQQPPENRRLIEKDGDPVRQLYLNRYFADFDASIYDTVGSIVMNCNPFTFGHRHLIEYAAAQVDFLIIFVVEEDASLFSFEERFAMVCAGTADLPNVMAVPSGNFILSKLIFPEYFIKETDEEIIENTENDITLFAEKIAPALGITHRFVGEEREDAVTNSYNQAMKRILPAHGIQFVEIPRKQNGSSVISASRVRKCLEANDLEQLDELVPQSTKDILFYTTK